MSAIDGFLANNGRYAGGFDKSDLAKPPIKQIAVVACMDARLETRVLLGLAEGDDHVKASPHIPHRDSVRGFVYQVETGRLVEIEWPRAAQACRAMAGTSSASSTQFCLLSHQTWNWGWKSLVSSSVPAFRNTMSG